MAPATRKRTHAGQYENADPRLAGPGPHSRLHGAVNRLSLGTLSKRRLTALPTNVPSPHTSGRPCAGPQIRKSSITPRVCAASWSSHRCARPTVSGAGPLSTFSRREIAPAYSPRARGATPCRASGCCIPQVTRQADPRENVDVAKLNQIGVCGQTWQGDFQISGEALATSLSAAATSNFSPCRNGEAAGRNERVFRSAGAQRSSPSSSRR